MASRAGNDHHLALLRAARAFARQTPLCFAEGERPAYDALRRHGLAPLAYRAGLSDLRIDYAREALLAEQRSALLSTLVSALAEAGVRCVLLKGMAYASRLYQAAAERPMCDIDLLVQKSELLQAERTLYRIGATLHFWSPLHHASTWQKLGLAIDLHHSILGTGHGQLDLTEIFGRIQPAPHTHPGAFQLDPIDEILFHHLHLSRSALVVPLISYVDAGRMTQSSSPSQTRELEQRAKRYRVIHRLEASQTMLRTLLETPPEDLELDRPVPPLGITPRDVLERRRLRFRSQLRRRIALIESGRQTLGPLADLINSALARTRSPLVRLRLGKLE